MGGGGAGGRVSVSCHDSTVWTAALVNLHLLQYLQLVGDTHHRQASCHQQSPLGSHQLAANTAATVTGAG